MIILLSVLHVTYIVFWLFSNIEVKIDSKVLGLAFPASFWSSIWNWGTFISSMLENYPESRATANDILLHLLPNNKRNGSTGQRYITTIVTAKIKMKIIKFYSNTFVNI
jgi:hypothetical protein